MTRIITITSGKGGVGKTTSAINIGAALNSFGKEVIIVDANLTTPNVGLHLGAPMVPVSLNHVLSGKAKISDAIYEHESGTKIIPSSLSVKELRQLNHGKLKEVSKKLKKLADIVILDSAAGLGEEAIAGMEAADDIIIVTNADILAVTDALKTSKLVEQLALSINQGFESLFNALNNKLSFGDNMFATVKDIIVTVNSSGSPKDQTTIKLSSTNGVTQIFVGKAENLTNPKVYPNYGIIISWSQNGDILTVNNIVGLPADNQFRLRLSCFV